MSLFERLQFYLSSIGTGKKLGILAILLIAVSLPLTLIVSQQQQDVRQRASSSDFPTGFWNANLTLSWSNKTTNEIGFSNDDGSICFIFKANDGTWNGPKACSSDLAPWKGNVRLTWSNPVNGDLAFCNNSSLSDCWIYSGASYNHKGALSITPPWKNYSGSIFTWTNYNANQMAFCTNSGNPCWIWDSSSANFNPRDMSGSAPFGSFSADERILSWSNPKSNDVGVCNNTGTKCFFWSASSGWKGPINETVSSVVPTATATPIPPTPINSSSPKGSISGPLSAGLNAPLTFSATADSNGGILDRGEIYVAKKQGSSPASTQTWCPEDKRKGVNKEWCLLKSQNLSGASQSFQSDPFAFSTAGTYVVVVNARNQGDINCSGNPFSLLPGWTSCGENSKVEVTIGASSIIASIAASPSTPVSVNSPVNFTATIDAGSASLMKSQIWVAKKDRSPASSWCPTKVGGEKQEWCQVIEKTLSGSEQTFEAPFTFTTPGDYYAAIDAYTQNNAGRCSGNPFNLDSTWTSCGENSKVEIRVNPTTIPSITTNPTVTDAANGNVRLNLAIALQGIGAFNPDPKTQQREFMVELFTGASEAAPVKRETQNLIYNSQTKLFEGVINLQNISTNSYVVKIKTKKYLRKRWEPPLLVDATRETVKTVSGVTLLAGDIKDDTETDYNELNINDYNLYISCFGKTISDNIGNISCANSDLNDDGLLDNRQSQRDYSLLLESFRVRKGD